MKDVYGLLKNQDERDAIRNLVRTRFSKIHSSADVQSPLSDIYEDDSMDNADCYDEISDCEHQSKQHT